MRLIKCVLTPDPHQYPFTDYHKNKMFHSNDHSDHLNCFTHLYFKVNPSIEIPNYVHGSQENQLRNTKQTEKSKSGVKVLSFT